MEREPRKPRSSLKRNFIVALSALFIMIVLAGGYFSNLYGRFQQDYNKLAVAMRDKDIDMVEKQMDAMVQYHALASKWYLGPMTERYIFKEMFVYEAVETLLKRDFRALMDDKSLGQNTDNHLVAHILGVARAQYYQGLYQEKLNYIKSKNRKPTKQDLADLEAIVAKIIEEARPYFRSALDNSPGNDLHFEYPFNYDLIQNEESARQALENPGEGEGDKPQPLGYGDGDPGGKKPLDQEGEETNKLNPSDPKQPGGQVKPRKPKG